MCPLISSSAERGATGQFGNGGRRGMTISARYIYFTSLKGNLNLGFCLYDQIQPKRSKDAAFAYLIFVRFPGFAMDERAFTVRPDPYN